MVEGTTETHMSITSVLHIRTTRKKNNDKAKARFKRRISPVPILTRELNACEVRRLNHSTP